YSPAPFLCCSDGPPRFECARRGNGIDFGRRVIFRAKSLCAQQPRCGCLFSSLLGYKRTFLDRLSTLLRSGRRHHLVCRSAFRILTTADSSRSFFTTEPGARRATLDARRV